MGLLFKLPFRYKYHSNSNIDLNLLGIGSVGLRLAKNLRAKKSYKNLRSDNELMKYLYQGAKSAPYIFALKICPEVVLVRQEFRNLIPSRYRD